MGRNMNEVNVTEVVARRCRCRFISLSTRREGKWIMGFGSLTERVLSDSLKPLGLLSSVVHCGAVILCGMHTQVEGC